MRKMSFYNKDKNNNTLQSLSNALSSRNNTNINTGKMTPPNMVQQQSQNDNTFEGAGQLLKGGVKLYNGIKDSGLFNGDTGSSTGIVGGAANDYVNGAGSSFGTIGDAANNFITGTGGGESALSSAISSEAPLLSSAGANFNGLPLIGNALGGINGLANTGTWQGGVQGLFGVNENDSEIMQGINGTLNGGLTGFGVGGPVGAAIGAVLGLGSSFLDDF